MHYTPRLHPHSSYGFSLVELSIVLVIIGLLVGGIVAGQALIRSGELQSVIAERTKFKTAATDFKKLYSEKIPGDMGDATDFWGTSAACGGSDADGTCNGNNDLMIDPAVMANGAGETYQFWRQLSLSGLIVEKFSGTAGATSATLSVAGTNTPASRMNKGTWEVGYYDTTTFAGDATTYGQVDYGNYLRFGGTSTSGAANTPILLPEDAWKIDSKLDDGKPNQGMIIASHWGTCSDSASNDATASTTDAYKLNSTTVSCTLYFIDQF